MMDGSWYGWGWGWMMLMPLLWIGLVALVVWAVIRLARPAGSRGGPASPSGKPGPGWETPQDILDRRLASGEIDIDTYTQTRARLSGRDTAAS